MGALQVTWSNGEGGEELADVVGLFGTQGHGDDPPGLLLRSTYWSLVYHSQGPC